MNRLGLGQYGSVFLATRAATRESSAKRVALKASADWAPPADPVPPPQPGTPEAKVLADRRVKFEKLREKFDSEAEFLKGFAWQTAQDTAELAANARPHLLPLLECFECFRIGSQWFEVYDVADLSTDRAGRLMADGSVERSPESSDPPSSSGLVQQVGSRRIPPEGCSSR